MLMWAFRSRTHTHKYWWNPHDAVASSYSCEPLKTAMTQDMRLRLCSNSHLWPTAFWCWWFWRRTLGLCRVWHSGAPLRRPPWETKTRGQEEEMGQLCQHQKRISAIRLTSQLSRTPPLLSRHPDLNAWYIWIKEREKPASLQWHLTCKPLDDTVMSLFTFPSQNVLKCVKYYT